MGSALSSPSIREFFDDVRHGNSSAVAEKLQHRPTLVRRSMGLRNQSALHIAAEHGYVDMLTSLLQQARELAGMAGDASSPPPGEPRSAFSRGQPHTREELLRGVVDAGNDRSQTPLMLAAGGGHQRCVELLLADGANAWAVDRLGGRMPLHYAARINHTGIMALLIVAAGEDGPVEFPNPAGTKHVNVRSLCGLGALHVAAAAGSIEAIELLVQHGGNIIQASFFECTNYPMFRQGSTPLHMAAQLGRTVACKALLKAYMEGWGRDGNTNCPDPRLVLDGSGRVALQAAQIARRDDTELLRILRPTTPLVTIFRPEELQLLGPPSLKLLASAALRGHLESTLAAAERRLGRCACSGAAGGYASSSGSTDAHALAVAHIEQQGRAIARNSVRTMCADPTDGAASAGPTGIAASSGAAASAGRCADAAPACATPSRFAEADRGTAAVGGSLCVQLSSPRATARRDAAQLLVNGWQGGGCGLALDDEAADDHSTCGVCLDERALVCMAPCSHRLCVGCCRNLFKLDYASVVLCPFCRGAVGAYESTI